MNVQATLLWFGQYPLAAVGLVYCVTIILVTAYAYAFEYEAIL